MITVIIRVCATDLLLRMNIGMGISADALLHITGAGYPSLRCGIAVSPVPRDHRSPPDDHHSKRFDTV